MTVQELIDNLLKIEDKTKEVYYNDYFSDHEHCLVTKIEYENNYCVDLS